MYINQNRNYFPLINLVHKTVLVFWKLKSIPGAWFSRPYAKGISFERELEVDLVVDVWLGGMSLRFRRNLLVILNEVGKLLKG